MSGVAHKECYPEKLMKMKIAIMCGGKGKRLGSLTKMTRLSSTVFITEENTRIMIDTQLKMFTGFIGLVR